MRTTAEFAEALLEEARVALTAGEGFDAPGFVRISYATSLDRLREGVTRIQEFVARRERRGAGRRRRAEASASARDRARTLARGTRRAIVGDDLRRARDDGRRALALRHGRPQPRPPGRRRGRARRHRGGRGHRAAVPRAPHAAGRARRRHRLHRRRGARRGGVVLSMERFDRILEIDEANLLAVVQPNVITGDLQDAVEARGLFYPPDPASLAVVDRRQRRRVRRRAARRSSTARRALRAGARGGAADRRDHPHRLEGGEERRRLRPDAAARRLRRHAGDPHRGHAAAGAAAAGAGDAAGDVRRHRRRGRAVARPCGRVVPAALELIDRDSLERRRAPPRPAAGAGRHGALLLVEVDGSAAGVAEEAARVDDACRAAGATRGAARGDAPPSASALGGAPRAVVRAARARRRARSTTTWSCRAAACRSCSRWSSDCARGYRLRIPCFGHAGDGNIHVNLMVDPDDADEMARARRRSASSSTASSRSRARSPASTASASRRPRTSASSCRPTRSR